MNKFVPQPDEANLYLAHVAFRLGDSADTLRAAADMLDGRDYISEAELSELRKDIAAVARSLDAADGLSRYFAEDITSPSGITLDQNAARKAAHCEAHARGLVTSALGGEVFA